MSRSTVAGRFGWTLTWFGVAAYVLAVFVPHLFLVLSSFKSNQEIFEEPLGVPSVWEFDNYVQAFNAAGLGRALFNSVYITVGAVALTVAVAVPASYAISRLQAGRVGTYLRGLFGLGLLIPTFAVLVPTFFLAIQLGMLNDRLFVILFLPATGIPVSVILLTEYMGSIPVELEEAAKVDRASRMTILWRVILPLSLPGVAVITIFNFIMFWNEYIFALVLLGSGDNVTAQVALPSLQSGRVIDYGLIAAGSLIVMLPVFVIYMLFSRWTQVALTGGAVKG